MTNKCKRVDFPQVLKLLLTDILISWIETESERGAETCNLQSENRF